ncbi:MAG: nucleotide sugar dehydrogenase [SAR324 cluster bacterium]|nr:nucleotide sugar dehydrogenase [SAR324 cluster bacterium]
MSHGRTISLLGLGYVGLPVAVAFGRKQRVVGFDLDPRRIAELREGRDHTGEVASEQLQAADVLYTDDPEALREADFHIVAVPTPIDREQRPDLSALTGASELLGPRLSKGDIVVYESTVYPGVTEEICQPILERSSGLKGGEEFYLGYSPERINPGDPEHGFTRITKVVSAQDPRTLDVVAAVYASVVEAGVFRAADIRTAEAAKVIENTQRDLNIALVNELSMIFERMGIDTHDVLAAARTKWNFLPFTPGLVGGHCIGVDPYYLTYKAEQVGYHPEMILAGRRINDGMGRRVAAAVIEGLAESGRGAGGSTVAILGLTFKEDVPDLRNTQVVDIARDLERAGAGVRIHDPLALPEQARSECGLDLVSLEELGPADAVVVAVAHRAYREGGWPLVQGILRNGAGQVADVRAILDKARVPAGCRLWRL